MPHVFSSGEASGRGSTWRSAVSVGRSAMGEVQTRRGDRCGSRSSPNPPAARFTQSRSPEIPILTPKVRSCRGPNPLKECTSVSEALDTHAILKGRYQLLETLGDEGESGVVKALDQQHGRLVALKIRPVGTDRNRDHLLQETRVLLGLTPHP